MAPKGDKLQIRCEEQTAKEFRRYAVGFEDQEEALKALLREYRDDSEKVGGVNFWPNS